MTFWKVFSLSEIALNIILSFIFLKKKFTYDTYRYILTGRLWTLILRDVSSATLTKTFKACRQSPASFCHLLALCPPKIYFSKVPPLFKPLYTIHLFDHSCLPPHPVLKLATSCTIPSEKAVAPHFSTLAWKIPWMEEPGGLQSMGSLRVGHDWATSLSLFTFMHWRGKW